MPSASGPPPTPAAGSFALDHMPTMTAQTGLNPYPAYRPSSVPWLGDVPAHWEVVQLGRIGVFSKGSGGTKDDEVPDGIPCVRYGDLYTTHKYFINQGNYIRDDPDASSEIVQFRPTQRQRRMGRFHCQKGTFPHRHYLGHGEYHRRRHLTTAQQPTTGADIDETAQAAVAATDFIFLNIDQDSRHVITAEGT